MSVHCVRRYPEWQHMQGGCLACKNLMRDLYVMCASGAQGALPYEGRGVTAYQLNLPYLTLLSVAGYGRLQLETAHWATWVTLLQVVDN